MALVILGDNIRNDDRSDRMTPLRTDTTRVTMLIRDTYVSLTLVAISTSGWFAGTVLADSESWKDSSGVWSLSKSDYLKALIVRVFFAKIRSYNTID